MDVDVTQVTTWIDQVESLPLVVVVIAVALVLAILLKVLVSALDMIVKIVLVIAIAVAVLALVDPTMFREVDARVRELVDGLRS